MMQEDGAPFVRDAAARLPPAARRSATSVHRRAARPRAQAASARPSLSFFFSPDANKQLVAAVERSGGRREDARAEDEDADHCEPPAGAAARHPHAPNQSPTQEALDSPRWACRGPRRWRGGRCTWSSPSRTTTSCPRRTRWCTPPPSPEPALTSRAARWTGECTCAASSSRPLAHATSVDDSVVASVFKDKLLRFNSIVPDFRRRRRRRGWNNFFFAKRKELEMVGRVWESKG
jgi:hypothetical protein